MKHISHHLLYAININSYQFYQSNCKKELCDLNTLGDEVSSSGSKESGLFIKLNLRQCMFAVDVSELLAHRI